MKRAAIDKTKRLKCFSTLFKHCSIQPSLNVVKLSKSITYFDDYCDYILNAFGKYKSDMSSKKAYLGTFALSKWEKMSIADRKQHTISKCYTCCIKFNELQQSFPAQPVFAPSLIDPKLLSDGKCKIYS